VNELIFVQYPLTLIPLEESLEFVNRGNSLEAAERNIRLSDHSVEVVFKELTFLDTVYPWYELKYEDALPLQSATITSLLNGLLELPN
jgi:hypothetical protein